MHITKLEAKKLLRDTFEPKMNQIICALEAVEAAVLAPLISGTQVQEVEETKTILNYTLKGNSIRLDLVLDPDGAGSGVNSITVKVNNNEELLVELHKEETDLKQVLQGECTYTHNSIEDIYDVTLTEENNKEVSFDVIF
jgi:hypothetical protein